MAHLVFFTPNAGTKKPKVLEIFRYTEDRNKKI